MLTGWTLFITNQTHVINTNDFVLTIFANCRTYTRNLQTLKKILVLSLQRPSMLLSSAFQLQSSFFTTTIQPTSIVKRVDSFFVLLGSTLPFPVDQRWEFSMLDSQPPPPLCIFESWPRRENRNHGWPRGYPELGGGETLHWILPFKLT